MQEKLAIGLQSPNFTVSGARQSAALFWNCLNNMNSETFDQICLDIVKEKLQQLQLIMSAEPSAIRVRYEYSHSDDTKTKCRAKYVDILYRLKCEIDRRFKQPGTYASIGGHRKITNVTVETIFG